MSLSGFSFKTDSRTGLAESGALGDMAICTKRLILPVFTKRWESAIVDFLVLCV